MKEFTSFAAFALELAANPVILLAEIHRGLEKAAKIVEKRAILEIGMYQPATGPFPAWAQLSPFTEEYKERMGYPSNAPLLATGDLRDSIQSEVHPGVAVIGSKDERAVYHEFGTSRMPPRPIFGPALHNSRKQIGQLLGAASMRGITGGQAIGAEGYDGDV